jgi:hypothetical protein
MYYNVTGNNNSSLGNWAGPASGNTSLSNTTAVGNNTTVTASNTIHIGNTAITEIAGQVGWSTYSDQRFKKNIDNNVPGLDFILKLKPHTYRWDLKKLDQFLGVDGRIENSPELLSARSKQEQKQFTGFMAQEVEQAANELNYDFSGVVHPGNEQSIYSVRYAEFVVPLVKAVQEQQNIIKDINAENKELKERVEKLEQIINNIK